MPKRNLGKTATPSAAGNATTRRARPFVTPSARVPNVRCSANRRPALSAPFTASSPNAPFVARRTCARKTRARNVRRFALRLSATPLVSHRKRIALRYVKRLRAAGRVLSPRLVRARSASSNVRNQRVMSRTNRNAANAQGRTCEAQCRDSKRPVPMPNWSRLSCRSCPVCNTRSRTERKSAARAPKRSNSTPHVIATATIATIARSLSLSQSALW